MKGRIKDMGFGLTGELSVTLALPRNQALALKKLMDTYKEHWKAEER